MPRHQVIRRLAAHFPVVWVEPATTWREYLLPGGRHFLTPDRFSSPVPGLDVLTPGYRHPLLFRPNWMRRAVLRSLLATARRRLMARGARRVILYLWRDAFEEALDLVPHDVSCYHVDDEYTFSEHEVPNSPRETRVLRRVDQVIVHSAALLGKKGAINPHTARIPNGVDFRSFSNPRAEPPDLAAVPRPRIGYVGVVKKQLNLGLLVRLARERPEYAFVLVGPVMNVSGKESQIAMLQQQPNVYMLGGKPPEMLPAYVQHLDVCLMCYEVNEYTRFIYPLKLHEYMATGRPVVSSAVDAVLPYRELIAIASTDAEWLDSIDRFVKTESEPAAVTSARLKRASEHDWEVLVERIAALFHEALVRVDSQERGDAD